MAIENLIFAQDLYFMTQSNNARFELKIILTSGTIYCKVLLNICSKTDV